MSKKIKIEIKSFGGKVLFQYESIGNNLKKSLENAVERGANLQGANLRGADLWEANLQGADLREAENIPNVYKTSLYLLKYQPKNTKLRAFKYLNGNISPYQNFEYEIGKAYTVENSNNDETILCAEGINVATLDWCLRDTNCDLTKTYIEVEFCVKDLVVPYNSDGKFRIKKGGKVKLIRKLTKKELERAMKPLNPQTEE